MSKFRVNKNSIDKHGRQRGRVVRVPDLKSGGRSDH